MKPGQRRLLAESSDDHPADRANHPMARLPGEIGQGRLIGFGADDFLLDARPLCSYTHATICSPFDTLQGLGRGYLVSGVRMPPHRRVKRAVAFVGGGTITATKNEILTALKKPEDLMLAIVQVKGGRTEAPHYVWRPFTKEPDFGVTSVNYDISELLARAQGPR